MRSLRTRIAAGLLAALPLAAGAAPALSHGIQLLPLAVEECMQRGARALAAEGFGSPAPSVLMAGFKGPHGAYLYCGARPDQVTAVNIFVATEGTSDGEVPGAERLRLQGRMAAGLPAAPVPRGFAGQWDSNYGAMTITVQGERMTGSYTQPGGRIQGTLQDRVFAGQWIQADRRGRLRLELAPDGNSFKGTWTENDGRGGGAWTGQRR